MQSLSSSSRAGLWRYTGMESSSSSLMELPTVSSPSSTAIPLTTRKSESIPQRFDQLSMYSSRVLIANIKNMGQCPCPRCTIRLADVQGLGKPSDTEKRANIRRPTGGLVHAVRKARKAIFKGYKVSGTHVDKLLGGWSRAPNVVCTTTPNPHECTNHRLQNAFMSSLPQLNVFALLTVDLLHEVELGVWKALFTHIIRILSTHSPEAVSELDRRYAPAFSIE